MHVVLLSALGVGGATVFGAVVGVLFRNFSRRFAQPVLSFAAGVMLAATIFGLLLPAMEGGLSLLPFLGMLCGILLIRFLEALLPEGDPAQPEGISPESVWLFTAAIAIHNLPEGIAAGVGFGTGDTGRALLIAGGIALQNIPEGLVLIGPLLSVGVSLRRAFFYGAATGLLEVVGTFLGYFAIRAAQSLLPFSLAFAGGAMLYVIFDEMLPPVLFGEKKRSAVYALLFGFCFMLFLNLLLV